MWWSTGRKSVRKNPGELPFSVWIPSFSRTSWGLLQVFFGYESSNLAMNSFVDIQSTCRWGSIAMWMVRGHHLHWWPKISLPMEGGYGVGRGLMRGYHLLSWTAMDRSVVWKRLSYQLVMPNVSSKNGALGKGLPRVAILDRWLLTQILMRMAGNTPLSWPRLMRGWFELFHDEIVAKVHKLRCMTVITHNPGRDPFYDIENALGGVKGVNDDILPMLLLLPVLVTSRQDSVEKTKMLHGLWALGVLTCKRPRPSLKMPNGGIPWIRSLV